MNNQILSWRYPICPVCFEKNSDRTSNNLYTKSLTCKSKGHVIESDNIMITLEGQNEGASYFIYAIRSYCLKKYDDAIKYATNAIDVSTYDNTLNCFIRDLSTLLLVIFGEFEIEKSLKKLVKLANSIPLIPLVWITIVEYWKKLEIVEIDDNHYILELSYWDTDIPRDKQDVLKKLIALKNDVCNSYYTKEVLLNTCGFATEWVPSIWNLESPKSFLFTVTELTNLANKIGPLKSILKPISTNETYKIINDFVSETTNQKLDRSGTCASCGHCVSTKCNDNMLDFCESVKDIFSHKNVCRATWHPKYVSAPNGSKYFQRGEYVILSYKDKSYNAKILYQRRGFNNEPGKVALVSDEGAGFFPQHPTCSYNADCPFYNQKHGLYSENNEDYILIKKLDYNKNYQNQGNNFKSSLNFDSWVNSATKKIRVCLKCKASINSNKLPECSLAESELPIIPPAFIVNNIL